MERRGFMLEVRYGITEHLVKVGAAEGRLDLVGWHRNGKVPGGAVG